MGLFGTDGVRGRVGPSGGGPVGVEPDGNGIDAALVRRLGAAAAAVLGEAGAPGRFVVGRDTRESSPALAEALAAGLVGGPTAGVAGGLTGAAAGTRVLSADDGESTSGDSSAPSAATEVIDLGVATTPLVSHACGQLGCPGAVITASHNPYTDNGVKLFAAGGRKLSDQAQQDVAALLDDRSFAALNSATAPPSASASASDLAAGAIASYQSSVAAEAGPTGLAGLHLVLDCANGAATALAAQTFASLGATVTTLFDQPDGRNINAGCGSANPAAMQAAVIASGAHLGLALDGDGDRVVAADENGQLVDGDRLMALFAIEFAGKRQLANQTLVTTVMSNGGLDAALAERGISVVRTAVGDRNVLDELDAGGHSLGGEQSGHIILYDRSATGDGLRAGVRLAALVKASAQPLSQLAGDVMTARPQVLVNVAVARPVAELPAAVTAAADDAAAQAPEGTRVLVRPSGTEPLVRVMVEAVDQATAQQLAEQLAATVRTHLG